MWIIKWILSATTLLLVLLFAFFNQDQSASVKFFQWISPNLPLWVFLYISFTAGLLLWFSISAMNVFKYKGRIYSLQREIKKIQEELNRLRNASLIEDENLTEPEETSKNPTAKQIEE